MWMSGAVSSASKSSKRVGRIVLVGKQVSFESMRTHVLVLVPLESLMLAKKRHAPVDAGSYFWQGTM